MGDWEWSYRGLNFGGDTPYAVTSVGGGLMALPDIESSGAKRSGAHGYEPGRQTAGKRVGSIDVAYGQDTSTDAQLWVARDNLLAAFQPLDYEEPLVFGFPGLQDRQLYCRVTNMDMQVGYSWVYGFAESIRIEVTAEDLPFWQSTTLHSLNTGATTNSVGRAYNLLHPRTYGALGVGNTMRVVNAGNMSAPWDATITGPCVNPQIQLEHPNGAKRLRILTTLGTTADIIVLRRRRELVLLGGTSPRYDLLDANPVWFDLPPGTSDVRFTSDDQQGTCSISWRDTWY